MTGIKNWSAGRFLPHSGWNQHDGTVYNLRIRDANQNTLTTWANVESATVAAGLSNGTGWADGNYQQLGRAALATMFTLYPNDANVANAYNWLNSSNPKYASPSDFRADPTFNIVPLQLQ